ncbi:hypothetical protein [Levilactobacillus sp. N40-8-2]|uniref:hypothetical protein n=1 Tax=Levilactobacillus muriae TaxID=3238987 RepID=UPI0038B23440
MLRDFQQLSEKPEKGTEKTKKSLKGRYFLIRANLPVFYQKYQEGLKSAENAKIKQLNCTFP